jgi:hypothetical protein
MLTGCQMLLSVDMKQPRSVVRDHERLPSGPLLAKITTDESTPGWIVEVQQPYTHIIDEITVRPEGVRRYLGWPLAPLNGLFQCPAGLIATIFSDSAGAQTLRQIGCMRLIGMEPLKGVAERQTHETVRRKYEEDLAPVAGIAITFSPQQQDVDVLRGLTDTDGRYTFRHSNLLTTDKTPVSGRLDVTGPHGTLVSKDLTVLPMPPRTQPAITLPGNYPVIVQINSFRNADGSPNSTIVGVLTARLLKAGLCLTAGPTETNVLVAELKSQLGMRIDDSAKVRTGRVKHPTLIIDGTVGAGAGAHTITTSLYIAKTGERLVFEEDSEAELSNLLIQQLRPRAKTCGEY